ncbi:MAG: SsrA-binding protein [Candidatus Shikimatogenerans bostrichidophilus]|nr:MAG: SsrA-binding protein [Candidatus Shikimatogenerans bostrichidophilus]
MKKEIINKKARYYYIFIKKFNAGLILYGNEIKLIRKNKCNISNAYCKLYKNNIFLLNFKIHNCNIREIKLLLSKKEIIRINNLIINKTYTIIPTKIFYSESGFAKLEIFLSKRKKLYDLRKYNKKKDKELNKKKLKKYYY